MVKRAFIPVMAAVAATAAASPAPANEISIGLRATVQQHCSVIDIGPSAALSPRAFNVSVICNAPNFRLGFSDNAGAIPVQLNGAEGMVGQVSDTGGGLAVNPTLPGLYRFEMELAEDYELDGGLQIQLEGY